MTPTTKALVRSALLRAARTFFQSFLAVVAAAPLLDLDIATLEAAAVAGLGAVLALAQRAVDSSRIPTIPPG